MKKIIFCVSLLFSGSLASAAQPLEIKMKSLSFDPKVAQVTVGQPVVWKNIALTDHTATSAAFDTGLVHPGKVSKDVTFDKPGNYPYQCSVHGKTMSGTINVQAAASK